MLDNRERVGAILILAFSLVYLRYAIALPLDVAAGGETFSARTLPIGLSSTAIALALLQILHSLRGAAQDSIAQTLRGYHWQPVLGLVALMAGFALLFETLGFALSSFLFLMIGFRILGERRWLLGSAVAGALVLFLWLVLAKVFGLYLDPGDLYRNLGS